MPKYYVQSGNVSFVVTAADAEGAALWVLNRLIDARTPGVPLGLGQVFNISEIGFGRDEVAIFETHGLFYKWRTLQRAIQHLFDQLG
jgi:hypothetical protein